MTNKPSSLNELEDLANAYKSFKTKDPEAALDILRGVIYYCKVIKFDIHKTKMMLALVIGRLPRPGQAFEDARDYDEAEVEFMKTVDEEFQ